MNLLDHAQSRLNAAVQRLHDGIKSGATGAALHRLEEEVVAANENLTYASDPEAQARFDRSEVEGRAKWDAVYRAETEKAMKAYRTAAKGVERLIRNLAAGDAEETKLRRALDNLFSRSLKAEIRDDAEARAEVDATESALRGSVELARQAGVLVRRDASLVASNRLIHEERARREAMSPGMRQYQDELALLRGRR